MNALTTRRNFLQTLALLPALPLMAEGHRGLTPQTVPRIGYLGGAGVLHLEEAFTQELQTLGFQEGANIHLEKRLARPNSTDAATMAAELAQRDLSLIVAASLPFALDIRKHNPRMPMVLATCPGLVNNGFAQSVEHPGGIYTGIDELPPGVTAKRLQLLKAVAPTATRIALLATTPGVGGNEVQLAEAQQAATSLGVEVKPYRASSLPELENALTTLGKEGMHGMLIFQGALTLANRQRMVDFAVRHRIPAIYQQSVFVEIGGLMAWAPDLAEQFREAARYVAKILQGAKPGDLPIKHPEPYFLTLNARTARQIGVRFSDTLLAEATKVFD